MTCTVRAVAPADLERWVDLRHGLWPDQPRAELAAEVAAFFGGTALMLAAVLIAVDPAGAIVGFVELSLRPYAEGCRTTPVAYLEAWYVAPDYRGCGTGRALVAAAEDWGRARGCREFASDALADNAVSAAAHAALGFEEVEQIRCFRKALTR